MGQVSVKSLSERSVYAIVTRAGGTVEDLGLISFTSRNAFRRWAYRLGRLTGIWRR
jgi:hypothetical protein